MAVATDPKHGKKDSNILAPALNFTGITPTNSVAFSFGLTRGLYVGVGGDITIYDADGTGVLFKNVPTGSTLPVRAGGVASTGTAATDIVALY